MPELQLDSGVVVVRRVGTIPAFLVVVVVERVLVRVVRVRDFVVVRVLVRVLLFVRVLDRVLLRVLLVDFVLDRVFVVLVFVLERVEVRLGPTTLLVVLFGKLSVAVGIAAAVVVGIVALTNLVVVRGVGTVPLTNLVVVRCTVTPSAETVVVAYVLISLVQDLPAPIVCVFVVVVLRLSGGAVPPGPPSRLVEVPDRASVVANFLVVEIVLEIVLVTVFVGRALQQ